MKDAQKPHGKLLTDKTLVSSYWRYDSAWVQSQVDGLGNALVDFDDPNLPSLLSIPLLGYRHYDLEIYRTTAERLWSKENSYYFNGTDIEGLGSPHTGANMVWPLSVMVQVRAQTSSFGFAFSVLAFFRPRDANTRAFTLSHPF
jgi:meiotically up-regulated gene 157 (Mug157) protein